MFKVKEGLKLFDNQTTVRYPTGNYGSFEIDGGAKGSWEGFSIGGRAVFMHDNGTAMGLYNDVNNQWGLLSYFNGETRLYYAGNEKLATKSDGVQVQGLLKFNSGATTTSQSYGIEWTGFDKEGTTDYSDSAYIKHLTNTAGLGGSVLEISSMNDANDGINLKVNSSTAGARVNGNPIFHEAYHPNADKWTTARTHTVTLTGDVTGSASQSVDGTGNRTWTITTVVGNNSHTHDTIDVQDIRGTTRLPNALAGKQVQSFFNNQTIPSGLSSWYSTLTVKGWDGSYAAWELAGNATSSAQDGLFFRYGAGSSWNSWQRVFTDNYHPNADKWTTARTLSLTGDVTGSVSWDGSANASITTTVVNDSHNHDHSDGDFRVNGELLSQAHGQVMGVFKGHTNHNHMITLRGNVTGSTSSPVFDDGHQTCFVEFMNPRDDTVGWFFKDAYGNGSYNYTNVAQINTNGITAHQGGFRIGSTTVIDSSRNLTNIGGTYKGNFGTASFSWGGSSLYPTLYGSHPDRWVMMCFPHIPYLRNGHRGYTGNSNGAVAMFETYSGSSWQSGVAHGVSTEGYSIARGSTDWALLINESDKQVNARYGLKVNSTTVIDSSRNLTNIANATASGTVKGSVLESSYWVTKQLTGSGIGSSYNERVILLCPKVETNTAHNNIVDGKITALKTGGNVCDTFDVFCHSVWNDTRATYTARGQRGGHKLVEFNYDGIKWIGIKFSYTANPYNYFLFQGQAYTNVSGNNGHQLKVISYYDTRNGGSVLNSEIYNSLVDYNGNGINHKTTASTHYFADSIGSTDYAVFNSDGLDIRSGGLEINGTSVIDSNRNLLNLSGSLKSDNEFILLTSSSNAQTLQTGGIGIGSSYSSYPAYTGGVNVQNGYQVAGTTVIDSSRNLTNIKGISASQDNVLIPFEFRKNEYSGYNGAIAKFVSTHGHHSWGINTEHRIDDNNGDMPSILFSQGANSNTWSVGFGYNDTGTFRIKRDHGYHNGGWGTALMSMDRNGNVTFAGNVTAYSDERLKTNIKTIENPIDIISKIRGVSFDWKETGEHAIGVIAQEIEAVPELSCLVSETPEDGTSEFRQKNVAYGNMVGLLIEAIKEQQAQIAELQAEIKEIKGVTRGSSN